MNGWLGARTLAGKGYGVENLARSFHGRANLGDELVSGGARATGRTNLPQPLFGKEGILSSHPGADAPHEKTGVPARLNP